MPEPFDLNTIPFPEGSELPEFIAACPDASALRFANDEYLIRAEEAGLDIFLLIRGSCLVEHPAAEGASGAELAVVEASPDAPVFVGEMAYFRAPGGAASFSAGYRTASVRSAMSCWALRLAPRHLDLIIERFPGMTRVLCRQFTHRLRETNEMLRHFQEKMRAPFDQRFLQPGDTLFEAGRPAKHLFQLVHGAVREQSHGVSREIDASPDPAHPVFLGARAYFTGGNYEATVAAASGAILLVFGPEAKAAVVRNHPGLLLSLLTSGSAS